MKCERCGKETNCYTMSMMNTQMICMDCKREERNDPMYEAACEAERNAVRSGNYNYKGLFG